ncbi:hypothetical protein FQA39_LY11338 [Lamprigera yunnana]|nr:hypothetical protein FQA39_LY11338 [Lamprigera yunnana]
MANTELAEVATGNSRFANKFYSIIAEEEKGKNVFFSPISAHTVLSLAYQGAAGSTAESFTSTLNVGSQQIAATGYSGIMKALNSVEDVILHIANKVYVMQGYPLKENFIKAATQSFFSEAEQVNFSNNIESAKNINDWVEKKTESKIKDLIAPDCLNGLTRLVLVNAVYFKGNWAHKFNKEATRKEKFYITKSETVECDMMHTTKRFNYREDSELDAKILEMKYTNPNVSMVIILPNEVDGIEDLEKKLVKVDLSTITNGMRNVEVQVSLPKFKIETEMDLESVLRKMGLGIIFDPNQADFSEIAQSNEQLYVSKAIQKAFIEVNEEGAEAAAATGLLIIKKRCLRRIEKNYFICDRPIILLMKYEHESTTSLLFFGKLMKPKMLVQNSLLLTVK